MNAVHKEEDSEISKEDKDDDKGGGTSDSLEDSQDNEYKNENRDDLQPVRLFPQNIYVQRESRILAS